MRIYESLAISYYYFGDVKRSNYYLDRFTRGKYELTNSFEKQSVILVNKYERAMKGPKLKFTQKNRKGLKNSDSELVVQIIPQSKHSYEMLPHTFEENIL